MSSSSATAHEIAASDTADDVVAAVVLSPLMLAVSSLPDCLLRRLTTRCFRFRPVWGLPCRPAPRLKPAAAEP